MGAGRTTPTSPPALMDTLRRAWASPRRDQKAYHHLRCEALYAPGPAGPTSKPSSNFVVDEAEEFEPGEARREDHRHRRDQRFTLHTLGTCRPATASSTSTGTASLRAPAARSSSCLAMVQPEDRTARARAAHRVLQPAVAPSTWGSPPTCSARRHPASAASRHCHNHRAGRPSCVEHPAPSTTRHAVEIRQPGQR